MYRMAFLLMTIFTALWSSEASAQQPALKFPFPGGETWKLTRAYNDATHINYGGPYSDDRYAIDLVQGGCDSLGKPVLAAAAGTVEIPPFSSGYGNSVLVHHPGGCTSRVAHLSSFAVTAGQTVSQGQRLGIIGNSGNVQGTACSQAPGMHIHYVLYCNGHGVPPTPISGYTSLSAGTNYTSDNYEQPFDFVDNSDNVYVCSDPPTGGQSTGWIYSCQNRQTVFDEGDDSFSVVHLRNIRRNIRFRVEAWRVGDTGYAWSWDEPTYRQVEPNTWEHTFFTPEFRNLWAGDWKLKVYTDTGGGFSYLTSLNFIVLGGDPPWYDSPYQYNGNSYHCKGGVTGGQSTNWIYTCNGQQSSYTEGDTVTALFRIDNIHASHRFRARVFRDNIHQFTWTMDTWNQVQNGQSWGYAYSWIPIPTFGGSYEVRYDVETVTAGWDVNVAVIHFTVNPGTPFTYNNNVSVCPNNPTGGQNTNWIYTCPGASSSFMISDAIRTLVYVENVRKTHRWRGSFYRNGSSTPYYVETTPWMTIPSGEIWGRAYSWPTLRYPPQGNWRSKLEIDVGNGWQLLKDNISFAVNAPSNSYPYDGGMQMCEGYYEEERNGIGVPQCWNPVWGNEVDSFSRYYWRLPINGLTTTHSFRVEMYRGTMLDWSWEFGPYSPPSGGTGWFFPEFDEPAPGSWRAVFFVKTGTTWKYLNEFAFISQ